jgi:hypothetical protein
MVMIDPRPVGGTGLRGNAAGYLVGVPRRAAVRSAAHAEHRGQYERGAVGQQLVQVDVLGRGSA